MMYLVREGMPAMLPTTIRLEIARLRHQERLSNAARHHAITRNPLATRLLSLVYGAPARVQVEETTHPHVARVA